VAEFASKWSLNMNDFWNPTNGEKALCHFVGDVLMSQARTHAAGLFI
jgi:hypothetical protein